jgi:hypothetical protein
MFGKMLRAALYSISVYEFIRVYAHTFTALCSITVWIHMGICTHIQCDVYIIVWIHTWVYARTYIHGNVGWRYIYVANKFRDLDEVRVHVLHHARCCYIHIYTSTCGHTRIHAYYGFSNVCEVMVHMISDASFKDIHACMQIHTLDFAICVNSGNTWSIMLTGLSVSFPSESRTFSLGRMKAWRLRLSTFMHVYMYICMCVIYVCNICVFI